MSHEQQFIALGLSQISSLLSLSERTVWGLTKNGQIPHFRVGRRLLFHVTKSYAGLSNSPSKSIGHVSIRPRVSLKPTSDFASPMAST